MEIINGQQNLSTAATGRTEGTSQVFVKNITSAADAGDVTLATVTQQPCLIESVVVVSNGATTTDLSSISVFGGASKVEELISTASGAKANIDAADEQVSWTGALALKATKTLVIVLAGTGSTAVNLTVYIKYLPIVDGGYLA